MPAPRPNLSAHLGIDIAVNLDASPALLDALYRFTSAYTNEMETEMAKLKTEIARLDKAVIAAEEEKARLAAIEAEEDAAELAEDEEHAAAVTAHAEEVARLTAERDALQKRVDDETATPAEEAKLTDLISRIEKLGPTPTEPEPAPEPTPEPTEPAPPAEPDAPPTEPTPGDPLVTTEE